MKGGIAGLFFNLESNTHTQMSDWIAPLSLYFKLCNSVDDGDDDDGVIEVIKEGRSGGHSFLGHRLSFQQVPFQRVLGNFSSRRSLSLISSSSLLYSTPPSRFLPPSSPLRSPGRIEP